MPAPNFDVIRGGQILQAGDARAIFLKLYGGEVFASFAENNVFIDRHMVRTLTAGKSASFPSVGGKTAVYHTPGTQVSGQAGNLTETIITVDDFIEATSSIAEIDLAMTHFDYRTPFTKEDGKAIARLYDQNVARVGVQAGLTTTSRFAGSGDIQIAKTVGHVVNQANSNTDAAQLKAAMLNVATAYDEKDIDETGRNLFLRPAQYYLLAADNQTISSDFGGAGDLKTLRTPQLYGFNLVKTTNLPNTNVTGTYQNKYNVDARNMVALAMKDFSVGTLKVRDLSVGMTGADHIVTHNATLIASRMLVGHGVLRPEGAAVIRTAVPV